MEAMETMEAKLFETTITAPYFDTMALVVQSFGNEKEYRRAVLTVISYYAFCSPSNAMKTLLFTDRPSYFEAVLKDFPVEFILLSEEKIQQMRGKIDFLHRMKIALIEEAFQKSDDSLLYADSDTFFTTDPMPLFHTLSPAKALMHVYEYAFESLKTWTLFGGETNQKFYNLILNHKLMLADGSDFIIRPEHASWNAGVMMLDREHAAYIPDIYKLTDQIFPTTGNHASEQFAFSVILQTRTKLEPCESVIYHYWYRVMKRVADEFLAKKITSQWAKLPADKKMAEVKRWTQILPRLFDHHVLMLKDNAIQAFNIDDFRAGYRFALRAFFKQPFDLTFLKHVAYHTRRNLSMKK